MKKKKKNSLKIKENIKSVIQTGSKMKDLNCVITIIAFFFNKDKSVKKLAQYIHFFFPY